MSLLTQASLVLTPNAVKASKLYSIIPSNGNGDMTVVRATTATRVNSLGLIESVATNVARLNYDSVGGCPSVLVEPQRTNLLLRSEEFENAIWASGISTSVTANTTISPNGTITADTSIFNSTTAFLRQLLNGITNGAQYTLSFYAKASSTSGASNVRLSVNNTTSWTGASSTKVALTSSWQRITLTWTSNGAALYFIIGAIDSTGAADTSCYGNVDIWGAQLELGAYVTSYIPTITATTRNADVISKTGISDLIGQTEGTLFCDLRFTNIGTEKYIMTVTDTSGTNVISLRMLAGGAIRAILTATTSSGTTNQSSAVIPIGNYKLAYTYKSGSLKLFINGVLSFTLTPTFTFGTPLSIIRLGMDSVNSLQLGDSIKSIQLYKTALTDAECIALTTL